MQKDTSATSPTGRTSFFNNPFSRGSGRGGSEDPAQRRPSDDDNNAIDKQRSNDSSLADIAGSPPEGLEPTKSRDRSESKEWDASKVPPSRFQKRQGSIYATASSRDSHLHRKDRDSSYFAKLKEKGWH
jgi:hypothetical protein